MTSTATEKTRETEMFVQLDNKRTNRQTICTWMLGRPGGFLKTASFEEVTDDRADTSAAVASA